MAKKESEKLEFRYYDIPPKQDAITLYGPAWKREYGKENPYLHFHNLFEIGCCYDGTGIMQFDDKTFEYRGGMISVIPTNYPHNTVSDGDDLNYWEYIFFDMQKIVGEMYPNNPVYQREVLDNISKNAFIVPAKDEQLWYLFKMIINESVQKKHDYQLMIKALLKALMVEIIRINKQNGQWIGEVTRYMDNCEVMPALEYIESNFGKEIKVKDLSEICNMSETFFRRKFEEQINMPPIDYVNWIRIQNACKLIVKTDDSMSAIAQKCGFNTQSTFHRNFQRYLYTTPYKWKKNYNGDDSKKIKYNVTSLEGW